MDSPQYGVAFHGPFVREDAYNWLPFLANAMAFAAGYPCHGARERYSPFAVRVHGIAFAPDGDAEIVADDDWTLPKEDDHD